MLPVTTRRMVARVANELLTETTLAGPPVDPLSIARSQEIVVEGRPDIVDGYSGCLLCEGSTFGIFYSTRIPSDGFQRFTVAHELGHAHLPHHLEELFSSSGVHLSRSDFSSPLSHELEADYFAAELLMPDAWFRKSIRSSRMGKAAVQALANEYSTSLTSTALRYAHLTPDPVAIIVSEQQRILFWAVSESLNSVRGVFFSKNAVVSPSSITHRFASEPKNIAQGREAEGMTYLSAWFENAAVDLEVREDVMGLGAYGRTLTILHADEVPDQDEADEEDDPDHFTPDGKRYRW